MGSIPIGVTDSVFPGNPTASGSGMTGVFRWLILVASSEFAVPLTPFYQHSATVIRIA